MGANLVLNYFNDRIQQRRVQEALTNVESSISSNRQQNPSNGVLLQIFFTQVQAPPDSLIVPGAVFSHIRATMGRTRSEALRNYRSTPDISPNGGRNTSIQVQQFWIPPLQPIPTHLLSTPFPHQGFGIFGVNQAILQDVMWGGVTGFDDEGQTSLNLPANPTPRFIILRPSRQIIWYNGRMQMNTSIPIVERNSGNGVPLNVVDLDPIMPGNVAAVPIFPYNNFTARLLRQTPRTKDNLGQLNRLTNISLMRWVRPENIIVMAGF